MFDAKGLESFMIQWIRNIRVRLLYRREKNTHIDKVNSTDEEWNKIWVGQNWIRFDSVVIFLSISFFYVESADNRKKIRRKRTFNIAYIHSLYSIDKRNFIKMNVINLHHLICSWCSLSISFRTHSCECARLCFYYSFQTNSFIRSFFFFFF